MMRFHGTPSAITVASLFVLMTLSAPAKADVTFSNFGPADSYNPASGYAILSTLMQGNQFTSSLSGSLSSINVAMGNFFGSRTVTFILYLDVGNAPGRPLETWRTNIPGTVGSLNPPITLRSAAKPKLTSKSKYWLLTSSATNSLNVWNFNNTGVMGNRFIEGRGIFRDTEGAFRVNVSIPAAAEPGTVHLILLALAPALTRIALGQSALRRKAWIPQLSVPVAGVRFRRRRRS